MSAGAKALRIVSPAPRILRGASGEEEARYDKPSEFTVPLCATHHQQLHTTTKEREWWQERNIDPLEIALRHGGKVVPLRRFLL